MAKPWKVLIVGVFAEEYLVDIATEKLRGAFRTKPIVWKKNSENIDLANLGVKKEQQNQWDEKVLPFFVCEKIDDFRNSGLKCPYEFVIERKDLFDVYKTDKKSDGTDKCTVFPAADRLRERIGVLKSLNSDGIPYLKFKDWMSGVMRRYLFLDDTAHGTSGCIDSQDPNWNWTSKDKKFKWVERDPNDSENKYEYDTHGQWLRDRFSKDAKAADNDSLKHLKPFMRAMWLEYFDAGKLTLQTLSTEPDVGKRITRLLDVYNSPETNPLPLSQGDRARFVTPTGKISVLLIDDDANKSLLFDTKTREIEGKRIQDNDKQNAYEEAWKDFDKIFSVQPFELKPDDFPKFEKRLNEILTAHLSYDFALVDLCFGEDPGCDPLGYHVIKKLSKLFPHMPIIVYSRYKDMGHIMRAFQCGAMWFLQKGEEQKLARHLMDVVKKGSWKREWRAMQEYNPVEFVYNGKDQSFDDKFRHTDEWKYLTAKSLEFFPGKFIEVKKMGGGISTASTFSVQKGLKLDGNALQSPMIIKIDTAPNTRMEYQRYFRYIRPYMANEAGRIEKPCIIIERNCSAIVYTFAGRQDKAHALDSMKNMLKEDIVFKASCDYEKYRKAFDMIFDEILPKIHRVTPNREFGDGEENRHQEVFSKPAALDAKTSPGASFPNLQFGEVEKKDFYQTYLIRFPHFGRRELGNNAFVCQPRFVPDEDGNIKLVWNEEQTGDARYDRSEEEKRKCYEYHDIYDDTSDGSIDLEVYDIDNDRKPYRLAGPIATHVAKFRQQMYPGAMLWIDAIEDNKKDIVERVKMFDDRVGKDSCQDWLSYVNKYLEINNKDENDLPGKVYFDLVDNVLDFCKALYGADKANYKKYIFESEEDQLFKEPEARKFFEHIRERFRCPIAICHGDLNYGNIMLESRKHPPKDEKPDVSQTITDAWLIDFARTRRDLIAHDFNVMFTDTFALLFDERLFNKSKTPSGNGGSQKDQKEDIIKETWDIEKARYERRLDSRMRRFIEDVMFAENSNSPDYLNGDARFEFVYKILRRIRKAALDSGISEEMYTLTTVLECLMALKLHLKKGMKNIRASAALFAVAKICFEHLCEDVELDLLSMGKDGKTNKQR